MKTGFSDPPECKNDVTFKSPEVMSWADFTSSTTLHGIRYTCDKDVPPTRKWIWIIFLCGMGMALITFLSIEIRSYLQYDFVTKQSYVISYDTTAPLPSITFCNNYMISNSSIYSKYPDKAAKVTQALISYYDPAFSFDQLDPEISEFLGNESFVEFFKNVAPVDIIIRCEKVFVGFDCAPLLQAVYTDIGACWTFHSYDYIQQYGHLNVSGGIYSGVRFWVRSESSAESIISNVAGRGYHIKVHSPDTHPNLQQGSFVVGPGKEYFVAMEKSVKQLLKTPYNSYDCVDDENSAEYADKAIDGRYSPDGCFLHCMYTLYPQVQCQLFELNSSDVCTVHDYMSIMRLYYQQEPYSRECYQSCHQECRQESYVTKISSSDLDSNKVKYQFPFAWGTHKHLTAEEIVANYFAITFYYETFDYVITEQQPAKTVDTLLASFGGFLGLFVGASVLTLLEFIDFFVMKCIQKVKIHPKTTQVNKF